MYCRPSFLPLVLLATAALAQDPRPLPALEAATLVWDSAAGASLAWPELLDRLAPQDVVFLGETHVDDTTHRVELQVLQGLLERRQGKVVLSLEMFERDVQPVLDDYLQGRCDEAAFLAKARPWPSYRTSYRPLVEAAKVAGIPVVAANFPGSLRRRLAQGGKAALDALSPAERALLPAEIHPASAAYWERVDRAVRGHMGGGGVARSAEERRYEGQNLWDNAMGDSVAKARAAHPDRLVLHVAGGFHVAYRDGTVAQLELRSKGSKVAVASIAPVPALHAARPDRDLEQADYLIYATTLARDLWEGTYAVHVPAELRYRLHVPESGAAVPLLVWLPDRASRPQDALALWRLAMGDDAAVAVVEPPFPEVQDDLAVGGRYAFGDGFRADYGRVQQGLAQIVEYVTRRLPVDGRRVVIAGAGDGGAAVLWTALYGEWLDADLIAVDPTDLTRLAMEALPDRKPLARSLRLAARGASPERLEQVAADARKVGTDATVVPLAGDGGALVALVRARLALPERAVAAGGAMETLLVLENAAPRAREWAELYAARLRVKGIDGRIVAAADVPADTDAARVRRLAVGGEGHWPIASFANGDGLPLAGGPFGGTTVVVLPRGASAGDRAAWLELEQTKAIRKRGAFASLLIASADAEPGLPQVLERLRQRGRSRVLIVPAVFCAEATLMHELRQQLGAAAAGMDVSWLPGLGGELASGG